jgi:hypothetical protein
VKEKPAEELIDRETHDALAVVVCGIAPPEGNVAMSKSDQSVVGDGDAVSVVFEIAQHLFWSTEGRLGIDHPVLSEQRPEPGSKGSRISERSEWPVELNRAIVESCLERSDELPRKTQLSTLTGRKNDWRDEIQRS